MRKPLCVIVLLLVILGSFWAGSWYRQSRADKDLPAAGERRILYYVDPMNPAHTSDKPGIAPCGMAMEPVYAEDETSREIPPPGASNPRVPGTVKITPQKQQLIGVQIDVVELRSENITLRTLGRVTFDENRLYSLIAATEGWMWDAKLGTTGSLVQEGELIAQIGVYNNDFFSWQQRYLADLGYVGRAWQPGLQQSKTRAQEVRQPKTGPPEAPALGANESGVTSSRTPQPYSKKPRGIPPEATHYDDMADGTESKPVIQPEITKPEKEHPENSMLHVPHDAGLKQAEGMVSEPKGGQNDTMPSSEIPQEALPLPQQVHDHPGLEPNNPQEQMFGGRFLGKGLDGTQSVTTSTSLTLGGYYANRAKLELLNLGFGEAQLEELARTGQYETSVKLRSPVTGLIVSRNVSPRQRIDKGTELFKIADLSLVWVIADVFSFDAHHIRPGTKARVSLPQPSASFDATVSNVVPLFDPVTRTLKVRLETENTDYILRPDMFVDVELIITLPPSVTVPAEAVLDSGLRKTVFVAIGNGFFEPRAVVTGYRMGGRVEVLEGLVPGEQIVISGNFLIDAESRMKLAAAGFYGTPEKDPVCGMDVYPGKAKAAGLTSEVEGKNYFFCSEICKAQFNQEHNRHGQTVSSNVSQPSQIPSSEGILRDPVCGMVLQEAVVERTGLSVEYRGKIHAFCSKQCKQEFEKTPQRYLIKATDEKMPANTPSHGGDRHD